MIARYFIIYIYIFFLTDLDDFAAEIDKERNSIVGECISLDKHSNLLASLKKQYWLFERKVGGGGGKGCTFILSPTNVFWRLSRSHGMARAHCLVARTLIPLLIPAYDSL